jgi:hypothetical protein
MSTADKTSKHSAASSGKRKAGFSYTPGAPVAQEEAPVARKAQRRKRQAGSAVAPCPHLPPEILDNILSIMASNHDGLSVIKLSMVNRSFRDGVRANLNIWYRLYLHWRGPVRSTGTKEIRTPRGVVYLRPTIPVSVPNFRIKTPPLT